MNTVGLSSNHTLLALAPTTWGIGFTVFEGPHYLVDWGVKNTKLSDHQTSVHKANELIDWYRPTILICEDCNGKGSRRARRVQRLIESFVVLAESRGIVTQAFSRADIRETFADWNARTKDDIAHVIANKFQYLEPHLPRRRKPWRREDRRMSIFDAASLALTLYHNQLGRLPTIEY